MVPSRSAQSFVGSQIARLLALCIISLFLVSCSFITPARMAPETFDLPNRKISKRLHVGQVTGARDRSFGGPGYPSNEQIKEALVTALQQAKIFSEVSTTTGDIELTVSIISQNQEGFIPFMARMVANYKVSAQNGDTVWSETYDTTFGSANFAGAVRTVRANEGAVRENLKAFIQGINDRLYVP